MPTVTIPLSKAYPWHDGDFRELKLREPTGLEFTEIPIHIRVLTLPGGERETKVDFDLAFKWAARLSGVSVGVLHTFTRNDTMALVAGVTQAIGDEAIDEKNSEG